MLRQQQQQCLQQHCYLTRKKFRPKTWRKSYNLSISSVQRKIKQVSFVLVLFIATIHLTHSAKIPAPQLIFSTTSKAIDPTKIIKTTTNPMSQPSLSPTLMRQQNDITENVNNANDNNNDNNYNDQSENLDSCLNNSNCDRETNFVQFSIIEKDVVDRLVKEWAPIVWLAPEEKFMPLGVEEFLKHVHPIDKDKSIISGMPIGQNSERAYLVTNTEIDELLKNEKSFIYGHNPTEKPVPIYAVVTLCNQTKRNDQPKFETKQEKPPQHNRPLLPSSKQNPYIPVSFNIIEKQNNTIRRSSRLYPTFQRVQRDLSDELIPSKNINGPSLINFEFNSAQEKQNEISLSDNIADTPPAPPSNSANMLHVNQFIANLADNVKFSPNIDNNIRYPNTEKILEKNHKFSESEQKKIPPFHVTYWMFYPYSQGKTICTLSLGPLGHIPFPVVYGFCLGQRKDIGNHIGDWEHMSIYFNGSDEPESLYVSAHDAGAYYTFNRLTGSFEFKKQETRKGILQRPNFPKTVTTFNNHPVLFAAKGSHGLWTAPGKHRFVKVARLYDINGFGTLWSTWKAIHITYESISSYGRSFLPTWLSFKGKWGNPKSKCHPFRRIGLNFCEYTDGPTGIPLKESHFQCGATYR